MNSSVWGPHYWFFLHTICLHYPIHPNEETKKIYYDLFQHFHCFIPVPHMAKEYQQLLATYPITPYLDNRESILKWIHFIHNQINQKLEKPTLTYSNFLQQYYQLYEIKTHHNKLIQLYLKRVFHFSSLCFLLYLVFKN